MALDRPGLSCLATGDESPNLYTAGSRGASAAVVLIERFGCTSQETDA